MGSITKTYTETSGTSPKSTWTVAINMNNFTITGNQFTLPTPTITAKYSAVSGKNGASAWYRIWFAGIGGFITYEIYGTTWAGNTNKSLPIFQDGRGSFYNTNQLFNSSNKTSRTATISLNTDSIDLISGKYSGGAFDGDFVSEYAYSGSLIGLGAIATATLDMPPTFSETFSYTGDFSGVPYANLTTASVSLSSLSAKCGGDFSGVGNAEFIIGSQSVSKPNPVNGDVLTIALNAVGTFNPIVKITDSRGQVTTHTLNAITVMGYNAPTVSFDASRTLSDGTPDDEGTYAFLEATFTFTDVIADAVAPSVVVTDDDGTVTTPVVDWYTDAAMTSPVTWSSLSSGDTVYGIFSGLSTQHSYTVSIRPRDSEGTGTAVTQTIGAAFYTVDFLAGGHGIAFGKPAANVGFECAMEATFEDDAFLSLPDYQTASTNDKAIYDAVVALGWDSDVLIN